MSEEMTPAAAPAAAAAPKSSRKAAPATPAAPKIDDDVFAFGSGEMPEIVRTVAEKSVQSAKDTYEKMRTAAEETTDMLEDQIEITRSGMMALSGKMLEAAKTNVDVTFEFVHEVMAVKSFAEAIELQASFTRRQFDMVTGQAKDMQALFQKFATDAAQPAKDAFTKITAAAKAA